MGTTSCTRCGRILPPTVVRELARGARCPFCAVILERPKAKLETPLYGTPAAKNPAFATTMPGRARFFEPGNAAAAASPEAKAWLNALLRPSAMASPLAEAASAAASPAVVEPAPVAPAPTFEPPEVAPAPALEPPAVPPAVAAAVPVVEMSADKRPTVPMAAIVDSPDEAPAEPAPPAPPTAAQSVEPPPLPVEALEEADEEPAPAVRAEPPRPPPRPVAAAVPRASIVDDSEALIVPVGNRRPRVLIAVGAVVLGGVLALILQGAQPGAPPAPVAATPSAEPAALPTPTAAPVDPPKPTGELALEPSGAAKATAPAAEASPAPAAAADESPPARRRRPAGDEEPASAEPAVADEAATLRSQGLEYEKQGKVEEALAAYREYLSRAKRTRDRVAIARRMYDLTHPGE